jgi:hypothetical protein
MIDFSLIKDRYSGRPKMWKVTYFLMNTDYLMGLLRQGKLLEAVDTIHAYGYVSGLCEESGVFDENEKKVFNNLLTQLRAHLENLYKGGNRNHNLKMSLDYLQDLYVRVKEKLDLKAELGYNVDEDPEEVFRYYVALSSYT